jgi:fructokinase
LRILSVGDIDEACRVLNKPAREAVAVTGRLIGCVEAGGTKFLCAVAGPGEAPRDVVRIATATPQETIGRAIGYFRAAEAAGEGFEAFGIASFGPVELDPHSPHWGSILKTPKPGWSDVNLVATFAEMFSVPIGFDTDVNAAAIAEAGCGEPTCLDDLVYVTVGTGIGGGAVTNGAPVHGARHPEMGHIFPPRHRLDHFAGICPFHGDCLEGLASGSAIQARWGATLSALPPGHEAHDIVAWYLAHLAMTIAAILAPRRIVFGGGVMQATGLVDRIRSYADRLSGGYFDGAGALSSIIHLPRTGLHAGLIGAQILARQACKRVSRD